MEQELAGKVAIVTGAGRMRSIGRPIAKRLAQAAAAIVITGTGRPPERYPDDEKAAGWRDIDSVADEIRQVGGRCLALVSDIADPRAVDALVERAVAEFGRLDILINNASAARGEDRVAAIEVKYDVWKKVMVTNVDGTFLMSCAAARRMIALGHGGSIVNISSIASKIAAARSAAYAASKAAVNALSRSMALDLAPNGIRVNAICPSTLFASTTSAAARAGRNWSRVSFRWVTRATAPSARNWCCSW